MPTKRDLKNARRLEKLKARVALRLQGKAPELPAEASVEPVPERPVILDVTAKFAGSEAPLESQTVTAEADSFEAVVVAGRTLSRAAKALAAVVNGTPDMPCHAPETPVLTEPVQVIEELPPVPDAVLVRIYLKPRNPRMRLIELVDGTHGRLWLKPSVHPMIGWMVWARAQAGSPGDFDLHGRYNGRGTRTA